MAWCKQRRARRSLLGGTDVGVEEHDAHGLIRRLEATVTRGVHVGSHVVNEGALHTVRVLAQSTSSKRGVALSRVTNQHELILREQCLVLPRARGA